MDELPTINVEDPVGKTVGRRRVRRFGEGEVTVEMARRTREIEGGIPIPKGVHRFRTHEEAEAWTMAQIAANRKS